LDSLLIIAGVQYALCDNILLDRFTLQGFDRIFHAEITHHVRVLPGDGLKDIVLGQEEFTHLSVDIDAENSYLTGFTGVLDRQHGAFGTAVVAGINDVNFRIGGDDILGFLGGRINEPCRLLGNDLDAFETEELQQETVRTGIALHG